MHPRSNTKSSLRKQGFWLSVLLLLACCLYAADDKTEPPQKQLSTGVWVTALGKYYAADNVTTEEARRKALQDARQNAIQEVVGIRVSAHTLLFETETLQDSQESFVEMSQSNIYGYIIEEKDPVWHPVESIEQRPGDPQIPLHSVTLEAKVVKEEGEPDPRFRLKLQLNQQTFRETEELTMSITPTQDCYLTVFNILSDHTVLVLYPSKGQPSSQVNAQQAFSLPTEAERSKGIRLRVGLLPGKTQDAESLLVVATKADVPFLPREGKTYQPEIAAFRGKVILPTFQSALEEINRWLVSIPANKRTSDMQQYEIRKK